MTANPRQPVQKQFVGQAGEDKGGKRAEGTETKMSVSRAIVKCWCALGLVIGRVYF